MTHFGWPQGIYVSILALSLILHAALDGEPREGKYKFSVYFVCEGLTVALLWWGGFFG